MKRYKFFLISAAAACMASCTVNENFDPDASVSRKPLDPDRIQSGMSSPDMGIASADTLTLTFVVPGSNEATKAALLSSGKDANYICEVSVDGHHPGCNAIRTNPSLATKSIFGENSTNAIPCNFLRLDEDHDAQHTALYTFPPYNRATVLEGTVEGAPEGSSRIRSITLKPEQSYSFYSQKYSETARDSIFYHTRLIGWHPAVCSLPQNGKPVEFGDTRYTNYLAYIGGKYGIVFDHALDGATDILVSTLAEGQRWHSNSAPASGQRDNRYRDLAKQLPDDHYRTPLGYNQDQSPTYNNSLTFHHYLSAIRIWAKVAQDEGTTLNLSTWGKILSLTLVDQPSTCTLMLPTEVGGSAYVLQNSWTDYANHATQSGLIYGEGDIDIGFEDQEVTYPIDMTRTQVEMEKKYLGYGLVMPGEDIVIAIQTSAGTYQATLPHKILKSGDADSTTLFSSGNIYDLVLNLSTKGSVAEFIENEDTGSYTDLSPWDAAPDKQEFKTANCYIVDVNDVQTKLTEYQNAHSEDVPGYCFLATLIGNGESGIMSKGLASFHTNTATIATPASAKIVWQSEKGLLSNVHLQHGYIRFNVPQARKGNAVIAAIDEAGTVVWSWHIWITDTPQVITTSQNYNYMDRNLGAITTADGDVIPDTPEEALKLYGLYYQWGRKDPLPGPLKYNQSGGQSMRITPVYNTYAELVTSLGNYIFNQGQSIVDGIENPMHYLINPSSPYYNYNWTSEKIDFLWGEEVQGSGGSSYYQKSIYDPCPYGYHVPAEEIQYLCETADTINYEANQYGLFFNNEKTLFLPYAGYYGPDRNQTSNDGAAYYCGTKGDYQSSVICSNEDGVDYSFFRDHRLRTYISYAPSWTEQNTDGSATFSYNASDHYVTTDNVKTHHDYTNRRTASSVRCIKETNYDLNIEARMSANPREVSSSENTSVTFTLDGRTNKGVIKSATLVIHYTQKNTGTEVTVLSQNLATVPTAIFTSKTLYGSSSVTIPATSVADAEDNELYARLDLVISQGTAETSKSSVEYQLKEGFVLTIVVDTDGTKGLIPAYKIDDNVEFTVLLPGGTTETRSFPATRLVKSGNMYPPVIGQPTTITAYVNASDATVTINGASATRASSEPTDIGDQDFYPYSISKQTWSDKGRKSVTIGATKSGRTITETITVPVYGINANTGSKINAQNINSRTAVTSTAGIYQNWYIFHDQNNAGIGTQKGYIQFNGLNFAINTSTYDYKSLMGFETTSGATKIYNAVSGVDHPISGTGKGTKLVIASSSSDGTSYTLTASTRYQSNQCHIHIKEGDTWWAKYNTVQIFDEYQIRENEYYGARWWFYPVTFSVD